MTVYTWAGFSKGRNSTKQPTGGTSKTMTLKAPTSLISPVFLVENFSLSDNYLQWGNRYYYINDIVLVNNNLAEYHCNVDPLASWKSSIAGMTEFVARSASSYDGKLPDMFYPAKAGYSHATTFFTGLRSAVSGYIISKQGYYVLGILSPQSESGSVTFWLLEPSEFLALCSYLFSDAWLDQSATDITVDTQKQLVNPMQYIVSCLWFPFDSLSSFGVGDMISFGWWQTNASGKILYQDQRMLGIQDSISVPSHPEAASRGAYLNGSPFTSRTLYVWGFGQMQLDPDDFVNGEGLQVDVGVDLYTGSADLTISATSGGSGREIGRYTCQAGVPIQLAQTTREVMHAAVDFASGILSALHGNFGGAVSGVGNSLEAMYPKASVMGSTGSSIDYYNQPLLMSEFKLQAPMDPVHNGRPLCQNVSIGSLSGYIKTENAEVDLPCTQEERDMIAAYMDGGFYYE